MIKKYYILLLFVIGIQAQELPPIIKYPSAQYNAGNQNWMITQDKNRFIYFANNEGLLEFNGANWTLNPSPNETIIRSVKVIDDKIFTGCYMEFGFWKRQTNGQLKYTSLSKNNSIKLLDDEQFWNIINFEHWVIFQSLSRIYIYDTKLKSFKIISPKNGVVKAFNVNNSIYFQTLGEGLFEIENGDKKLINANEILKNNKIVAISERDSGLQIQTQNNGIFQLENGLIFKNTSFASPKIEGSSIYSSQLLSDGSYALGTISNGIFIVSSSGSVKYHITQNKGLSNNTALSLFEDLDKNLWIGLDNGINCINLQSPVKSFVDDTGVLGTVYASIVFNNNLYIGTNQGLFYKKLGQNDNFSLINGTKGQVWSLFEHQGTLFCGHDSGTFVINGAAATAIFTQSGTWKFQPLTTNKNIIFQGNYYGISVLEKINNNWTFRNKIKGFDYSSKFFEINKNNEIYVSHEYKGVFKLKITNDYSKTISFETFSTPKKGKNAGLIQFNNVIYYASKDGIFKLNTKTKQFQKDAYLSSILQNDQYSSGKMIVDASNKLWLFTKNYIHYFSNSKLSNQLKQNIIPIPSSLSNSMLGYENITQIANYEYLIGTTDGYYTINLNNLSFRNYSVSISNITINRLNEDFINCNLTSNSQFQHDENNIIFNYTVPEFDKYINTEYQYLLEGFQENWSEWSSKTAANFKNLEPGTYIFKVRAKIANSKPENIAIYEFTILKPWYKSNFALFIYLIISVLAFIFTHKQYKKYYRAKEQKLIEENNLLLEIKELENEQQLMKLKNEQLSIDVESKNKELAVSTMSLIKKNELLNLIKEDLKSSTIDSSKNIKSVISTISKNINEEDSWNIFKEAFDNADNNFLKKVKQAHNSLTPNDLRLCAYLRLNLSSKEIAPLLNISVRSVEIKRYRLRKKMDLNHEQGLVEYILSF